MADLTLFRFRNRRLAGEKVTMGQKTYQIDREGFVEGALPIDAEAKMRAACERDAQRFEAAKAAAAPGAKPPVFLGWERVAMNSDSIWQERFAGAAKTVRDAKELRHQREQGLMEANALVREAERQFVALEAEKARFDAMANARTDAEPVAASA